MTETLVGMDAQVPGPEPGDAELSAARELVRQAQAAGLSLTGPDGLLKQLTKSVIEAALDEEMSLVSVGPHRRWWDRDVDRPSSTGRTR